MDCKGNAFSSIFQSLFVLFSQYKIPDNGLYTKYIKSFGPCSHNILLSNEIPKYCK